MNKPLCKQFETCFLIILYLCLGLWVPVRGNEINTEPVKVGLTLGGGGTRGYAHIGVLRVLKEHNIPIDLVIGTSMGSIVGGLFSAGLSCDQIEKILMSDEFSSASELSVGKIDLVVLPISVVPRALVKKSFSGLYKGNKFADFLNSKLPNGMTKIEQLPTKFGAVAFNLLDGRSHVLRTGDIGRALQASSAVPELRQPVPWQGMLLVDGGVTDNLPCILAREAGANILIAVNVDERLYPQDANSFKTIGSVSNRCVTANLARLDSDEEKFADVVIHPEVSSIKLLSRNKLDMERAVKAGEQATRQAIPGIIKALEKFGIQVPQNRFSEQN
ncbi:hypothetical protein GC174_17940 [bacterium]|nr:hypothetical protein [bacterium]